MSDVVEVAHREDGPCDGPAVVLSNSLGSTLAMWDPQVPALAEQFRVVRYDHRGHGASPVPPGPYRLEDLGRDVLALLDRLEIQRAHFCGLSLGGMVGMWLATHAPECIDRLVLCCTSCEPDPRSNWEERAALVRERGTEAVATSVVERWFTPRLRERDPELARSHEAMIASQPAEGYAGCCDAIVSLAIADRLATITAPTLVIAGAEDPATPPEHAERIAAAIHDAHLEVLPGAAHLANVERADAVTRLLLDHLTKDAT